ncbi:MAG: hypothetical protein IPH72_27025 [Sandaracinaceae bacterium]|nr:hypothetical protein [Sandaracinaceae bacterium]
MFSLDLPPGIVAVLTALQVMWIIASSVHPAERRSPQANIADRHVRGVAAAGVPHLPVSRPRRF